ncbi:zinc-binding alcohol dehydrogenase family protein [Aspergillus saccharolyticus JOP 1030-1]|uniref:Oxidoreductase n=1 Tax=Aspergillus saccharolyticus JOP 1030-1 TaxID=1450539 RepID=A0A318ZKG6_9EURO|nr:oxidoreductase [Aspergillus saccharolyticus JOP 1030-1]PYH40728.1 oxidoreductase [Aspergillus saccharolyticus JOP 1030-1]
MTRSITAAWLVRSKGHPFEVRSAPYTQPGEGEVVIRTHAVAINPIDWTLQGQGTSLMYQWLTYPNILGTDVAGEVVEVGQKVSTLRIGDRILGKACGTDEKINSHTQGGFQLYVVLAAHMVCPIPTGMSYEAAAVLPLGVCTAACGLFEPDQLNLQPPRADPAPTGQTVIIWGGASSVGSCAIQLARAAGYKVFATASPKNFAFVTELGATRVFDYRSPTVVADMIAACQGETLAGALTVGSNAGDCCFDILAHCTGPRVISMAAYPVPQPPPKHLTVPRTALTFMAGNVRYWYKSRMRGIKYSYIFASTLYHNGVGAMLFQEYLPQALADGRFRAAPEPMVYGTGLTEIQGAVDFHKSGVSAKKVVVLLRD